MTEEGAKSEDTLRKAHCASCGGVRNCDVRGHFVKRYDHPLISAQTNWRILQCRGCENTFVQTISTNSEEYTHEWNEYTNEEEIIETEYIKYYPAILKRSPPDWFSEADFQYGDTGDVYSILSELYSSLENDLIILASIGTRTAFDVSSTYLKIPEHLSFSDKLDELAKRGSISAKDRGRLETLVDGGSAAAHRGWAPDAKALASMVDILEQFIHDAIVLPERRAKLDANASQLKATIPAKQPRPKKAKASNGSATT